MASGSGGTCVLSRFFSLGFAARTISAMDTVSVVMRVTSTSTRRVGDLVSRKLVMGQARTGAEAAQHESRGRGPLVAGAARDRRSHPAEEEGRVRWPAAARGPHARLLGTTCRQCRSYARMSRRMLHCAFAPRRKLEIVVCSYAQDERRATRGYSVIVTPAVTNGGQAGTLLDHACSLVLGSARDGPAAVTSYLRDRKFGGRESYL